MNDKRSAGYSKRPLTAKLGIKAHTRIAILNAPNDYATTLGALPAGVVALTGAYDVSQGGQVELREAGDAVAPPELAAVTLATTDETLDLVHFFSKSRLDLATIFPSLKRVLAQDGKLWVSWPKRAAKVATDLDENIVRAIGLENGLVDSKVAAIDPIWSGLQFVYRLQDRRQAESG